MPTLPDLLDRLADDGDVAGFDAMFVRAVAALDGAPAAIAMEPRRSRRRAGWIAATAVVAAAAIAVPLIVVNRDSDTPTRPPNVAITTAPTDKLPVFPNVRSATAAELAAGTWTTAPTPPITHPDLMIWDGREVLMLQPVFERGLIRRFPPHTARGYVPSTNEWSQLPSPHIDGSVGPAVWTGREVLVFATTTTGTLGVGAAYDPTAQHWRSLTAPPTGFCPAHSVRGTPATPVWTGTQAIVFGYWATSTRCDSIPLDERRLVAVTYDPIAGRWNFGRVPSPQRSGQRGDTIDAVFAHGRVLARMVVGGKKLVTSWSPGARRWTNVAGGQSVMAPVALRDGFAIPAGTFCTPFNFCVTAADADGNWYEHDGTPRRIRIETGREYRDAVSVGDAVVETSTCTFGDCSGHLDAWDPRTGEWTRIPNSAQFVQADAQLLWTGDALIATRESFGSPTQPQRLTQLAVLKPARPSTP